MIIDNLRYFLYPYYGNDPLYFGLKFNTQVYQGYMSGGAGYIISKEALRRLVIFALPDKLLCAHYVTEHEDVEIGACLENVGVLAGDTRDVSTPENRGRFFPYNVESHLFPPVPETKLYWYWAYIYYRTSEGLDSLSSKAISFHYIKPRELYLMDYLIYSVKPYGISYVDELPTKISFDDVKKHFRKEKASRAKEKYAKYNKQRPKII